MEFKKIFQQLNIFGQCKKYGISLWQCPSFLFLIIGIVIVLTMVFTYQIGTRYIEEPAIVTLIVIGVTVLLLIINYIIIQGFERLAEASRMKSEFINVVSHQLRTPLTNLEWAVEFLMSGKLGKVEDKQIEYFHILKENISRMKELISNLLIISRFEISPPRLNKEEISLASLIQELMSEFEPFARASNVELEFSCKENLPKIFADSFQTKLVVENLLDNAIRYSKPQGKVVMKLQKIGRNLYFEIKDDGVGIPREDQKYIFQRFFRAGNILRYQTQGSGLGLHIAKTVLDRTGGKIGFKSEENKGSTFWFTLPIKS